MPEVCTVSRFRHFAEDRRQAFIAQGFAARHFFAHRAYYLPKCGPDAVFLAQRMCGCKRLDGHVELLLFAEPAAFEQFPRELFFDDDLLWHRQQFGKPGHIAFAYLFVDGPNLYGLNYVSDLVQRISRRRDHATRVEKLFRGWRHMLFNSILNFAVEQGIETVQSPVSEFVLSHTDKKRSPKRDLFERIYDRTVTERYAAMRSARWWVIDVKSNRDRIVYPERREEVTRHGRTICVGHDIERGLGHVGIDAARTRVAERIAPASLSAMLKCEQTAGIKATYSVVGRFLDEVRTEIERGGHCVAFHSYDHVIRRHWRFTRYYWGLRWQWARWVSGGPKDRYLDQLSRCRLVDRRVRGFRPPQSRITVEWNDLNLAYRKFEWCGTSSRALGDLPAVHDHLVKIPIKVDDFPLFKASMPFNAWEKALIAEIESNDFLAFGLHDCYADLWLPHYPALLEKISRLGEVRTFDAVADDAIFASAL
jgi:hypothetical protein